MRYRLRLLLGFSLNDIAEFSSLEEGEKAFNDAIEQMKREKTSKTPYTLILVDYKTEKVIREFTSYEEDK